jgi:hypothetical protein
MLPREDSQPRKIAARMGEAGDDSDLYGIGQAMNTTGILVVACIAARAWGVPGARRTSTLSREGSSSNILPRNVDEG